MGKLSYWLFPLVAVLFAGTAEAQAPCAPRDVVAAALAEKHNEAVIAQAIVSDGKVLEIFATPDGATWTAVMSAPNGMSCVVSAGDNWQAVTPEAGPAPGAQS